MLFGFKNLLGIVFAVLWLFLSSCISCSEVWAEDTLSDASSQTVTVVASGKSSGDHPQFSIVIDNQVVGIGEVTADYDKDEWQSFSIQISSALKPAILGVQFLNGDKDHPSGRKLFIRSARLGTSTFTPEDGVFQGELDVAPSNGQQILSKQGILAWSVPSTMNATTKIESQPATSSSDSPTTSGNTFQSAQQTNTNTSSGGGGAGGGAGGGNSSSAAGGSSGLGTPSSQTNGGNRSITSQSAPASSAQPTSSSPPTLPISSPPASNGGSSVPTICQNYGYNIKTYSSPSFTTHNVDTTKSYKSGYQWYFMSWNGSPPADIILTNSNGSISAQGSTGPNGQVASAVPTKTAPYFVGTAFGGGMCVQAVISFNPAQSNLTDGFPAFWSMALEHFVHGLTGKMSDIWANQSQNYEHFAEWDILEYYRVPAPGFLSSWIDWFGVWNSSCGPHGYCKVASSFSNDPAAIPPSTNWLDWHTLTGVWVPATATKSGSIQVFLDGVPIAPPYTWEIFNDQPPPSTETSPWRLGIMDRQHMMLIFGGGISSPINVKNVNVFQNSAANNLVN